MRGEKREEAALQVLPTDATWRELGHEDGKMFRSLGAGLQRIEALQRQWIRERQVRLRAEVARLESDVAASRELTEDLDERYSARKKRLSAVRAEREKAISDYSLVKGFFYMGMALLLVFADVAIIGRAAAKFLGYPWRSQAGVEFIDIFVDPVRVYAAFPDLLWLTVSVLLMGFFIKVWRDSWFSYEAGKGWRWPGRFDFWIFTAMLILALAAVLGMAGTRMFVNLGDVDHKYARIVMTLLGVALPLVSAGFFLKGYDALAKRAELWRMTGNGSRLLRRREAARDKLANLQRKINGIKETLKHIEEEEYIKSAISGAKFEYERGFEKGLGEVLRGGGELVRNIRGLIVQRLLVSRASK